MSDTAIVEVIAAHMRGEKIEIRPVRETQGDWVPESDWLEVFEPNWNFAAYDYRVKP